jgi:hypothetical protein
MEDSERKIVDNNPDPTQFVMDFGENKEDPQAERPEDLGQTFQIGTPYEGEDGS